MDYTPPSLPGSSPGSVDLQTRQPTPNSAHEERRNSMSSDGTLAPKEGTFDLAKVLRTMTKRMDEANIARRQLGVLFEDLRVVGLGATMSYQPTVGSTFNPRAIIEGIQSLRHPPIRDILSGFEGVVRPGEMLLVLGSPGSGCSTFLKTLTNRRSEYYAVEGQVHYDSISHQDLAKHFRGDVQYLPEDDVHFPTLTVGQTLDFSTKTRAPQHRMPGETREDYRETMINGLMNVFGLAHTRKTPVGDAAIRGVSGGEKKRVSIAEALSTRPVIGAWDNATRGLDASTALEFVQALRHITDNLRATTIVSIYQAGEQLYQQFDKVCVIYEGKMAYFGPANKARQYFIDMGYEPANRQTTADFLVAVTDPLARIPRDGITNQPRTSTEFAQYFKSSNMGTLNRKQMDAYRAEFVGQPALALAYKQSAVAERANHQRKDSAYTVSIPMQIKAVMVRRIQILIGTWVLTVVNLFSYVFQATIMGTVFIRSPKATNGFFSRGGVLFFALFFAALVAMAEIPALYAQRPIVLRHERAAMYHPFIEAVALTLVDIPITFVMTAVFCIIVQFAVHLQQTADQFFIFFLFTFIAAIGMKSWFRLLTAALKAEASAQTVAGISILVFSLYTGYSIPKPSMIGALRWLTYINPLRFGFEAILTNEFRTLQGRCANLVPQGPGYENVSLENQVCITPGALPGQPFVDGNRFVELSFGFSYSNTWMNFGILCAYGVGFFILLLIFTEYSTLAGGQTAAVTLFKRGSKAQLVKDAANDVGDEEKIPREYVDEKVAIQKEEMDRAADKAAAMTDIFTWQHIQYTVPISGEADRKLLDDVSGFVAPGKLTALMGESGAGKTTLLNVLAQRVRTGIITGDKFVNGHGLPADFQAQTGYCQQMDTHEPRSTVREALLFSAVLRQPANVPRAEKEAYVETCLKMCGLEKYADATIGSLDIEHKKRTTIGVELAAKPKLLLFLDEPTSGLDSQSAWAIMDFLRSLADKGQAILCTIHQPSGELFQVFDRLLLLRKGGQTVYFGDLGRHSSTLLEYFERNGARHCQEEENPAEYMLEVIGAGATATSAIDWHSVWNASPEASALQREIDRIHAEGRQRGGVKEALHSETAAPWLVQLWELLKRDASAHYRDPQYTLSKLALNIIGGLFIGFTFFKAKDSQQGVQNKLFAMFMGTILSVPLANQLQAPFINMRSIYEIRERPSRMYSWTALITSQILVELPWNILGSSLFFLTFYWTVGFETSRAGYTYLAFGVIFPLYYTTVGQAIGAMSPSAEIATILFNFLFSFVVTFNGVIQPYRELGWYKWLNRATPYTYLLEGLLGNAIGKQQINCSPVEFVTVQPPSGQTCQQYMGPFISTIGGYLTNPTASSDCSFCAFRTTDEFMKATFNIAYSHRWRNIGIMFAFIGFNVFLTFLFTYLFRIRTGSLLPSFKKRSSK